MTDENRPVYNAAVIIYPGADILDYAGPIEVLSHVFYDEKRSAPAMKIETVARESCLPDVATGANDLFIRPTKSIKQAVTEIDQYDLLIVPGAGLEVLEALTSATGKWQGQPREEVDLIQAFVAAESGRTLGKPGKKEKVLLSVCTGSFLLAASGCLDGIEATTHHYGMTQLEKLTHGKTKVLTGRRFVDAGAIRSGLRIVTSGGVSSGLDGSLHVVECLFGRDTADFVADLIEYERSSS